MKEIKFFELINLMDLPSEEQAIQRIEGNITTENGNRYRVKMYWQGSTLTIKNGDLLTKKWRSE